jgi:hypothetical protein
MAKNEELDPENNKKLLTAKLDFAEQVNEYFPFLKGKYKILTGIYIDPQNGDEQATLGIEIFNKKKGSGTFCLETFFRRSINKVITSEVLKQNETLRAENQQLKKQLNEKGKK